MVIAGLSGAEGSRHNRHRFPPRAYQGLAGKPRWWSQLNWDMDWVGQMRDKPATGKHLGNGAYQVADKMCFQHIARCTSRKTGFDEDRVLIDREKDDLRL